MWIRGFRLSICQVSGEERGYGEEQLELGGAGEPVAFVGEQARFVGHVQGGEKLIESMGVGDGDDRVRFAVEDERGREVGGRLGGVGRDEPAGKVDERADAAAGRGVG